MTRFLTPVSLLMLVCLGASACNKAPAPSKDAPVAPTTPKSPKSLAAPTQEIPVDQSGQALSQNGQFFLTFTPSVNPIAFQKLFALNVNIFDGKDKKTPLKNVTLDQVRATMPAHKHGMNVEPAIKKTGDGTFRVEGMRFHMKGAGQNGYWLLEFVVNDGKKVDTVKFDLQCCRS